MNHGRRIAMASYENVTFNDLNPKRQENVREKIAEMWADGYTSQEISKRVRVSVRSVSATMGNLTRQHLGTSNSSRGRNK